MSLGEFFTWTNIASAAAGVTILWCKLGQQQLTVWGLGKLWALIGLEGRARDVFELLSFIALGVFVGVGFTQPNGVIQAFTAGMGWTGLLTTTRTKTRK